MKRTARLTKREKKAHTGAGPARSAAGGHTHDHGHIHCVACGRHLDEEEFEDNGSATVLTCQHGSHFPSCTACTAKSQALLDEHDRTNRPVQVAAAWH